MLHCSLLCAWVSFIQGVPFQEFGIPTCVLRRSQWPRGLRRRSTAARLLRLWVRILSGAWMLSVVSGVCVVR